MSVATKAPLRLTGGELFSGGPNTGEFLHVRGGAVTVSIFSGGVNTIASGSLAPVTRSGDQAVFWSGAGRLNSAFQHQTTTALSGIPIFFYDSAVPGLSGVNAAVSLVACDLLGIVNLPGGASGANNVAGTVINFDTAFGSGLAVGITSGAPGVTFTFTPEVIPVTQ